MLIDLEPRFLTPLLGVRDVNEARIRQLAEQIAGGVTPEPITCFEQDGFILILDGHHRWAAYLLQNDLRRINVRLIDDAELAARFPYRADTIIHEVRWSSVYDWESALSVRLRNNISSDSSTALALTIVSGPSGVGKSRLLEDLEKKGIRLSALRTTTTRPPRPNESNGVDYDFVDRPAFERLAASGSFLEWQYIHGHFYGSNWDALFGDPAGGLRIKDLDPYGALQLKSLYPSAVRTVFVEPPDFLHLRDRLRSRGTDNPIQTVRRLLRAHSEMQLAELFEYRLVNGHIEQASEILYQVASRRTAKTDPVPFYEDESAHGSYVALFVSDQRGGHVIWRNLRHKTIPLLALPWNSSISHGFRCLESMVIDQLTVELAEHVDGGTILRELIECLDNSKVVLTQPIPGNPNFLVYAKRVQSQSLADFIEGRSTYFGLREAPLDGLSWKPF